jgi:tripartite-type tricarboxylate transporter receptor subunit TctC
MIARRHALAGIAGMLAFPHGSARAQRFPSAPIRLLVGAAPGGGSDTLTRVLAEKIGPQLGQPMIIEMRGGGGGAVALGQLKAAPPDGYTLAWAQSSAVTFTPLTGRVAYRLADFRVVVVAVRRSQGLLARADAPFRGWTGFIAYARERGSVTFATQPLSNRLMLERIGRENGFRVRLVQATGGAESRIMLLGGHVDIISTGSVLFSETLPGKPFQLLAVFDAQRHPEYPDAPTLVELSAGPPLYDHFMVLAPARTPEPVVARLADALVVGFEDPTVRRIVEEVIQAGSFIARGAEAEAVLEREIEANRVLVAG